MMKCVMKWNRLFVLKDRKVVVATCKKKLLVYSLGENTAQSLTKEIPLSGVSFRSNNICRYNSVYGFLEFPSIRRSE